MKIYGVPRISKLKQGRESRFISSMIVFIPIVIGIVLFNHERWALSSVELFLTIAGATWFIFVFAAAVSLGSQKARARGLQRRRDGIYFTFEDGFLASYAADKLELKIKASEIVSIEELPTLLRVSASSGWKTSIPRDTEHYAELRAELEKLTPIVSVQPPKRPSFLVAISFLAGIAITASLVLLPLSRETRVRHIAAATLVAALTWQYVISPLIGLALRPKPTPQIPVA